MRHSLSIIAIAVAFLALGIAITTLVFAHRNSHPARACTEPSVYFCR